MIGLVDSCCEFFPIMDIVLSLGDALGIPAGKTPLNAPIHQDNTGAFVLKQTLSPQHTPFSKYYAISTV